MVESNITPATDGTAVPILAMRPDWADGWRVTYAYLTDIIQVDEGGEQRRAVRAEPRRTFEWSMVNDYAAKLYMDQFIVWALHKLCLTADYHCWITMTSEMSLEVIGTDPTTHENIYATVKEVSYVDPLATTPPSDTAPYWLTPGMLVLLIDSAGRAETRTVAGFSTTEIQFTEATLNTFPKYTRIYPAHYGWLEADPKLSRVTNRVSKGDLIFHLDPSRDTYPNFTPTLNYVNGAWMWLKKHNWANNLDVTYQRPMVEVDYEYGVIDRVPQFTFPTRTIQFSYVAQSHKDAMEAIWFFMANRGRRGQFYLPSWEDDIRPKAMIAGSLSILIDGLQFGLAYKDSTVFKRVMLRMRDGRRLTFAVDFVEVLPDTNTSVIWLKERLPSEDLSDSALAGISWVFVARLGSDTLEVEWLTHGVAQFNMSFVTLENPEA